MHSFQVTTPDGHLEVDLPTGRITVDSSIIPLPEHLALAFAVGVMFVTIQRNSLMQVKFSICRPSTKNDRNFPTQNFIQAHEIYETFVWWIHWGNINMMNLLLLYLFSLPLSFSASPRMTRGWQVPLILARTLTLCVWIDTLDTLTPYCKTI